MRPVLAVGWDVGGWHGTKQAVAVARYDNGDLNWLGVQALFSISRLQQAGGSPVELIRLAWPDAPDDVLDRFRVTIAIDAPLGFPEAFTRVLASPQVPEIYDGTFYENPLAFRETDRWVYRTFGKRPLSAPFDKLGNNAVTAMIHARRWATFHAFRILPQHRQKAADHTIIEVYPALAKRGGGVCSECQVRFARLLPNTVVPGTDQYDAAICAALAASFSSGDHDAGSPLPPLIHPPDDIPGSVLEREGWIYAVPTAWFDC